MRKDIKFPGKIFILLILPVVLYFFVLSWLPLMEPDEGRYSAIPQEMNQSQDYVTPHLKHVVYLEKPPLCYWATAMAFKLFGVNDFSARLFVALCAWGCILLVYRMGRHFHDTRVGLTAAAIFATSLFPFLLGRITTLDMPLTFFICLATWAGYRHFSEENDKYRLYVFFFACGLAFLAKGLVGVVFPTAILFIWLILMHRWHDLRDFFSAIGLMIFLAVTLPWIILVQSANPDFFRFFFIQEHIMRFATPMHEKTAPFYYYLPIILAGLLPWLAYLPKAWRSLSYPLKSLYSREEVVFLLSWIGFILLFYSFSSSKLLPYIAPVFLPLAVFLGPVFQQHDEGRTPVVRGWKEILKDESPVWFMAALFLILIFIPPFLKSHDVPLTFHQWWPWIVAPAVSLIALCLLPVIVRSYPGKAEFRLRLVLTAVFLLSLLLPARYFLAPYRSAHAVSQAINLHVPADVRLYQYRMSLYGVDFYSQRRSAVVEDIGELRYGVERLPAAEKKEYFLSAEEFAAHCRQAKETFCISEHQDNLARLKTMAKRVDVLWTNQHFYLLHLKND